MRIGTSNRKIYTYDMSEYDNVVFCGDIHGEFPLIVNHICDQHKFRDAVVIIAGDCGFGFHKLNYYRENIWRRINKKLMRSHVCLVMIRGNHDDPRFFDGKLINYRTFKAIPDYSIISTKGSQILAVGGAISIDRKYRLKHEMLYGQVGYWPSEPPIYRARRLEQIKESGYKIDTVVSHTAPSNCEIKDKNGLSGWAVFDEKLLEDCQQERECMDNIRAHLLKDGHPLRRWFYGHFHQSWNKEIDGVCYTLLNINELKKA